MDIQQNIHKLIFFTNINLTKYYSVTLILFYNTMKNKSFA
jgi:hypothetical protein